MKTPAVQTIIECLLTLTFALTSAVIGFRQAEKIRLRSEASPSALTVSTVLVQNGDHRSAQ